MQTLQRTLSQRKLTEIYANYQPLYESNHIDEILLVTLNGLAPSANTMVMQTRVLTHVTFDELQNSLMDFAPYLTGLVDQFNEQGLSSYYVELMTQEGENLESLSAKWIAGTNDRPMAILGSYGMGKTTFAKRLSSVLAKKAIGDSTQRIPVLIRHGDISSEQSLEGLLGKAFTAASIVRNYTFDIFMRLNQFGRFVILLDGFDEMKHTLSWEGFKYNFRQINRLITARSRIILLGRPTAFLNDEEQQHALHGIRILSNQELREPDWPDYREVYIASFTRDQARSFLVKYFDFKISVTRSSVESRSLQLVRETQIDSISSKQFSDITRRPVQLKMLAEILPQLKGDVSNLTVTLLYSLFIDLIIEREQEKISRQHFSTGDRRRFARELAIWLWKTKKEMSITADDIPLSILENYLKPLENVELVRRDLVAACFLERKLGESLYFPHRSFQEFLVAEAIVDGLADQTISCSDADSLLTEEVASFLDGLVNVRVFQNWRASMSKHRGTLSWKFIKIWISEPQYVDYILTQVEDNQSPWYRLLITIAFSNKRIPYTTLEDLSRWLLGKIKITKFDPNYKYDEEYEELNALSSLFSHFCLTVLFGSEKNSTHILQSLTSLMKIGRFVNVEINSKGRTKQIFVPSKIIKSYLNRLIVNKKHENLDFRGTYPFLAKIFIDYCMVSDWIIGTTMKTEDMNLPEIATLNSAILTQILDYQTYDPFEGIADVS